MLNSFTIKVITLPELVESIVPIIRVQYMTNSDSTKKGIRYTIEESMSYKEDFSVSQDENDMR